MLFTSFAKYITFVLQIRKSSSRIPVTSSSSSSDRQRENTEEHIRIRDLYDFCAYVALCAGR